MLQPQVPEGATKLRPGQFEILIPVAPVFALKRQVMQAESVKTSPRPFLELLFSVIVWPISDKIAAIHVDIQDAKFNSLVLLPVSLKL